MTATDVRSGTLSSLQQTAATATDIWNDSCAVDELQYAIEHGAVGATSNPTIVHDVWKKDPARWASRVRELAAERAGATEVDLAWAVVEEMSREGAALLMPAFERFGGRQGRLSMQTNPTFWRSPEPMLEQGVHFMSVAPNIIVKFPATKVGIAVMEEATYRGVSVNCTVSFSVGQAVAAAEAVERGLRRREAEGLPVDDMGPVITIMVGRVEDWLKVLVERDGIVVHPAALAYSGVAVFKRAYRIFEERGFRARLLAAAIRHHLHWSEFVGGDVIITLPSAWQKKFNASRVAVRERIVDPVDPTYVDQLRQAFPDFERAYEPDGLAIDDFDTFPPSVRTLRAFIASYHDLLAAVTDAQLPQPRREALNVYVVVATWVAREGQEEQVEAILRAVAQQTQHEPGCREFTVYRSLSDPRTYMLYERYDDEAALAAHRETQHFKTHVLGDAVANDRLEQRFAKFYEPLD